MWPNSSIFSTLGVFPGYLPLAHDLYILRKILLQSCVSFLALPPPNEEWRLLSTQELAVAEKEAMSKPVRYSFLLFKTSWSFAGGNVLGVKIITRPC